MSSSTLSPAGWLGKLHYVGTTIAALGTGAYGAPTSAWRVVTGVSAFFGLVFITSSSIFISRVLASVHLQVNISLYIYSMGETQQQILVNSWNGKNFSAFPYHALALESMITRHNLNQRCFPVMRYFHGSKVYMSSKLALVVLDEALQILTHAAGQEEGGEASESARLRAALDDYLELAAGRKSKSRHGKKTAPVPDLMVMERKGIPIHGKGLDYVSREETMQHREQLTALLREDGRSWHDVYHATKIPPVKDRSSLASLS